MIGGFSAGSWTVRTAARINDNHWFTCDESFTSSIRSEAESQTRLHEQINVML